MTQTPTEHTITEAREVKRWSGQYGDMVRYDISLPGQQAAVELVQKASTTAPTTGTTLFGTIEHGKFGLEFKKAQRDNQAGGGYSRGGGRSPADTKAIQRQHSQEMALRFGSLVQGAGAPVTLAEITRWTDHFEADISSGAGAPAQAEQQPAPAPTLGQMSDAELEHATGGTVQPEPQPTERPASEKQRWLMGKRAEEAGFGGDSYRDLLQSVCGTRRPEDVPMSKVDDVLAEIAKVGS